MLVEFPTVSPILTVNDAETAIEMYVEAFDGKIGETRIKSGKIYYAEIKVGDSYLIVKDNHYPEKSSSPKDLGSTTGEVYIIEPNIDTLYKKCLKVGFV